MKRIMRIMKKIVMGGLIERVDEQIDEEGHEEYDEDDGDGAMNRLIKRIMK